MNKKKKIPADVYAFMRELIQESLRDWFKKEKWVRISTAGNIVGPCGTSKNKKNPDRCLPAAKARSLTKAQRAATARKKRKAGAKGKTVVKNTKKATVKKENVAPNHNQKAAPYGSGYKKVTKEDIRNLVVGLLHEMKSSKVTLGYDLEAIQNVVDHLRDNYQEGKDFILHIQRGDDLPNAITFPRGEFRDDYDLNDMLNYAQSDEDRYDALFEKKKKKDDRCTRIAKRKYDTWPSAYASGAVVRCRRGEIWKGVKEELNEQMDIYDEIANMEFGMDYEQLGSNEKEWVRNEIDNMKMRESLNELNCKHGKYFCPHDKVYKCRKGPKKSRS